MVAFFASCAVGVGQRPRPGSIVSGTDGRSWYIVRPDGVTFSLKVTFNALKGPRVDVSKNILSNDVKRSVGADLSKAVRPHAFTVSAGIGSAVSLARIAGNNNVN